MKSSIPKHLQQFHAALQAIPHHPGIASDRDRLKLFVQCTLKAFQESADSVFPLAPAFVEVDTNTFGFQKYAFPDSVVDALLSLTDIYAELVEKRPWQDVLGDYYQHVGSQRNRSQFFTPNSLASAIAQFAGPAWNCSEPEVISEITCGSGVLLLAQIAHGRKINKAKLQCLTIFANDIDPLCAAMCALQLYANQTILDEWIGDVIVSVGDARRPDKQIIAFRSLHKSRWSDDEKRVAQSIYDCVVGYVQRMAA